MKRRKKELWENLFVVWEDSSRRPDSPYRWVVSLVVNHNASADPAAPKYVTHYEIETSVIRDVDVVLAPSKEEAILRHAVAGGDGRVWAIEGGETVPAYLAGEDRRYRLVEEVL